MIYFIKSPGWGFRIKLTVHLYVISDPCPCPRPRPCPWEIVSIVNRLRSIPWSVSCVCQCPWVIALGAIVQGHGQTFVAWQRLFGILVHDEVDRYIMMFCFLYRSSTCPEYFCQCFPMGVVFFINYCQNAEKDRRDWPSEKYARTLNRSDKNPATSDASLT